MIAAHYGVALATGLGSLWFSQSRWPLPDKILAGLHTVMPPTDDDIAELAPAQLPEVNKNKRKGVKKNWQQTLKVLKAPLDIGMFSAMPFYFDYEKAVWIFVIALLNFYFGEFWSCMHPAQPRTQIPFAMLVAAGFFVLRLLFRIFSATGLRSYELFLGLGFGTVMSVFAFGLQLAPSDVFDSRIPQEHALFGEQMTTFLAKRDLELAVGFPLFGWQLLVALMCGVCSMLLFFPALRAAKCYTRLTRDGSAASTASRFFSHLNFLSPLACALLWIPPFSSHLLVDQFNLLSDDQFVSARFIVCSLACLLRLGMFRRHMQCFLDSWSDDLAMLNVDWSAVKQHQGMAVANHLTNWFLVIVMIASQYVAPIFLTITTLLLSKRGFSTCLGLCDSVVGQPGQPQPEPAFSVVDNRLVAASADFLAFWCFLSWFVECCLGLLKQRYMTGLRTQSQTKVQKKTQ